MPVECPVGLRSSCTDERCRPGSAQVPRTHPRQRDGSFAETTVSESAGAYWHSRVASEMASGHRHQYYLGAKKIEITFEVPGSHDDI